MIAQKKEVTDALKDLAAVRDAINPEKIGKRSQSRAQAYTILQALVLACSVSFAGVELMTNHQMTAFLRVAAAETEFLWYSVLYMAAFLAMISGVAAMIIVRSAKMNDERFSEYAGRHFRWFSDLSVFSDLGLKLAMLTALLEVGKSAWIAPMLFLFTCDYLLQRRVAHLSEKLTVVLALLCLAAGVSQFALGSSLLLWPLLGFSLISSVSLVSHIRKLGVQQ